ncbi:autotransporter domain-containing protein, partial [Rhizobium sp. CRIBSB]|nr:autotransporter domain-containing protein [Rhizobium sp. CRIBSB]
GISALGREAEQRNTLGGGRMFDRQTVDPARAELDAMLWRDAPAPASGNGNGGNGGNGAPVGGFGLGQGSSQTLSQTVGGFGGAVGTGGSQPVLNTGQSGYAPAAPAQGGVRIWTGGAVTVGEREAQTGQAKFNVRSSGVSMGADVALTPTLDLGFGGGFGEEGADIGRADTRVDSRSVVGVVYGSWRPQAGIHLDALVGFGQLDFDMQRRVSVDGSLVHGEREGDAVFGSLGLGYDRPVMTGRLSAYGRVETLNAELGAYTETGSPFWALSYEARDVESLQGVLGARYVWNYQMRDSAWSPNVRLELRREFADGGIQNLSYADWIGGPVYQIRTKGWERNELNFGVGLNRSGLDGWTLTTEAGARVSATETSASLRLALSRKF